jgi:catechol 2,3-dioxygenase-like lactoylglutathione lyase family enzyme
MVQNSPLHAYIPAKDVARARSFYEGKLGFQPKEEVAGGVVYEFGKNTACFLYPTPATALPLVGVEELPGAEFAGTLRHRLKQPSRIVQ